MKLSSKITLLVFSGLLAGIIFTIFLQIQSYQKQIKVSASNALSSNENYLKNILKSETQKLYLSVDMLMEDSEAKKLLTTQKIEELYNHLLPVFNNLKDKYKITQIFFIEPEPSNICLLRMHTPEKKGDVVLRYTYKQSVISKSYSGGLELGSKKFSLRAVHPYYLDGTLIGYIELGEEIDSFFEIMKEQSGDDYAVTIERRFLTEKGWDVNQNNSSKEDDNQAIINITTKDFDFSKIIQQQTPTENVIINNQYKWGNGIFVVGAIPLKEASGRVVGTLYFKHNITKYYNDNRRNIIQTASVFLVLALIFSLLALFTIRNSITKPIYQSIEAINRLSNKEINFRMPVERKDEIGKLNASINEVIDNFRTILVNIGDASKTMLEAANQLTDLSGNLAQSANEQAATTEEISSSMEQMLSTLKSNSSKADATGKVTTEAAQTMNKSMAIFTQIIESILAINTKIDSISEIAQRTHLLSINASIEASRAGLIGRGFKVVAEEVRRLALQSDETSNEIRNLSKSGNDVASSASHLLENILPEINRSASLVLEIIEASQEQETGAHHINQAILQLTDLTNEHSRSSEEVSESAEKMAAQARGLIEIVSVFKLDNK